jgi:hypothetical protein
LLVVATLVVGGAIAIGVMVRTNPHRTAFAIGVAVLGSLIASFYVLWVNVFVLGEGPADTARVQDAIVALGRAAPLLEQASEHGVLAVMAKGNHAAADWLALVDGAETELFIVGHALNKWCRDDIRAAFVRAVERVVSSNGTVQLVMLPLDGPVTRQLTSQRGKDYRRRIAETLGVLASINAALPKRSRARLDVRMLHDASSPMPYMLAGNDKLLITAPYPLAAEDSDAMLAVTVASDSAFAAVLRKDLRSFVDTYSDPVDLTALP